MLLSFFKNENAASSEKLTVLRIMDCLEPRPRTKITPILLPNLWRPRHWQAHPKLHVICWESPRRVALTPQPEVCGCHWAKVSCCHGSGQRGGGSAVSWSTCHLGPLTQGLGTWTPVCTLRANPRSGEINEIQGVNSRKGLARACPHSNTSCVRGPHFLPLMSLQRHKGFPFV